jgi:hypothetical protein
MRSRSIRASFPASPKRSSTSTGRALCRLQRSLRLRRPDVSRHALELEFLREIGRVLVDPGDIVGELHRTIGLRVCGLEFSRVVECAKPLSWTRDPFDRLIVGQAIADDRPLITKDAPILANYPKAVW